MKYFINVLETTAIKQAEYLTYRLYSGESLSELKRDAITSLMESWDWLDLVGDMKSLKTTGSLRDFAKDVNKIMGEYVGGGAHLRYYDLQITEPYQDLIESWKFYNEFLDDQSRHSVNIGEDEVDFYMYGNDNNLLYSLFEYLRDLESEYGVLVNKYLLNRIYEMKL